MAVRRVMFLPIRTRPCFRASTVACRPIARPVITQRWHSTPPQNNIYDFDQIKGFTESPSTETIIIDVREPAEFEEGYIPGAVNIPIKSQPDAILLSAEDFEDRFGFPKPEANKEVVFYCRSGVRSNAAAMLAQQAGYQNIKEYRGSWNDWRAKGGKEVRPGMSTGEESGSER
ncbi:Rhodanese-like protein [Piedraia hortae CBS 480.64]|uniref:Rhodanese-like protein n=1 Tax=Piedraia hortae CBS 480.64 TaxID=1314780 RepID=A0A6A7C4M9_9PEZI|nr:Rhodanese-like protein [Piedraia hortae CBS 480.64]